ncbi:MAG: alpha/beta hydrolase [Anaerolineaceae bacterium]|nr:alpha/beta hydrolase [Anaerolineaceae bacterium]
MKNRLHIFVMLILILLSAAASVSAQTLTAPMREDGDELDISQLKEYRDMAWAQWKETMLNNETLKSETKEFAMTFGEATMRYTVEVFGEMPDDGYPLYIAMHGGGADDTPDFNDSQWEAMQNYYTDHLDCGVYVAVRGVRDTWDTHFNPESYPLYDRLIEYMILTEHVDPNRVYLTGFSAGGDGAYAIGARMSDRFAAVNMSSGHPNGISMENYYNLPIELQAGEYDTDFDRNIITAQYGRLLDELQSEFPDHYEHRTLIHKDRGHNFEDYSREEVEVYADIDGYVSGGNLSTEWVNSYAPDWLDDHVRDPLPESIRWDLSTRAELRETDTFYYLSADKDTQGIIQVYRDGNYILLAPEKLEGDFSICFNEDMIDFSEPVHFEIADKGEIDVMLIPEESWLVFTTLDRGDPNYQFEAAVSYSWLLKNSDK